ncbi:MAG: hypothetical protein Tsb0020_33570 [Haliangiales bacterium]
MSNLCRLRTPVSRRWRAARQLPPNPPRRADRARLRVLATLAVAALTFTASACLDTTPRDSDPNTDVSGLACNAALIEVAHDIQMRYPNWGAAHHHVTDSSDKIWFHPAHQKKELEGFGVTLVTMHYNVVLGAKVPGTSDAHWEGNLNEPTLLFFEKIDSLSPDEWPLIGFGYHVDWSDDENMGRCVRPHADCTTEEDFIKDFLVHEAGYHIEGFMVADNDDLKSGRGTVDSNYCNRIDKDDVKDSSFICIGCEAEGIGAKHGRAWTMHVWVHPSLRYPFTTESDPWNRDGGNGWEFSLDPQTFGEQGNCGCDPATPLPPPSPVMGEEAGARVVAEPFLDQLAERAQAPTSPMFGVDVSEERDGNEHVRGYRIVLMSWFHEADDLGLLTGDLVQEIADMPIRSYDDFLQATQQLAQLPPGAMFSVRVERDQEPFTLLYRVGPG